MLRQLVELAALVVRQQAEPVLEPGDVLLRGLEEELDEERLRLVVALARARRLGPAHQVGFRAGERQVDRVVVVLPAVVVVFFVGVVELGRGDGGGRVGGRAVARGRGELVDEELEDLERGGDDGVLVGGWGRGGG